MKALIDTLTGIGKAIMSAINFVVSTIQDLVYIVKMLTGVISDMPAYFGWLPSAIVTLLLSIISIAIIYKVIGRDG